MQIHNVRLGHACNSSSTHSLIMLPPGMEVPDRRRGREFGWDYFTLASKGAKQDYLAVMLYKNLCEIVDERIARAVTREWAGVRVDGKSDYLDHQSLYNLPRVRRAVGVDYEFWKEMLRYLQRTGLAVLGGNDNDDKTHPLPARAGVFAQPFTLPVQRDSSEVTWARKDERYGYWTVFTPATGAKLRFSFDDLKRTPDKATAPELVDLKITDYCPYGCEYCYQGSTPKGEHAGMHSINSVLFALHELGVFEVALGGGEPTLHPNFVSVLESARGLGMNANFTTRNPDWLLDKEMRGRILGSAACFAFSAGSGAAVENLIRLCDRAGVPAERYTVQVVMGTVGLKDFRDILTLLEPTRVRLTLLGYKNTNRGAAFKPYCYTDESFTDPLELWMRRRDNRSVGIDTALARHWEGWLKAKQVPSWLYSVEEGKFSCYIDAVEGTIAPSSYCDPALRSSLGDGKQTAAILSAFATY